MCWSALVALATAQFLMVPDQSVSEVGRSAIHIDDTSGGDDDHLYYSSLMPRPASLSAALGDDVAPLMTEMGMQNAIADTVVAVAETIASGHPDR